MLQEPGTFNQPMLPSKDKHFKKASIGYGNFVDTDVTIACGAEDKP